MGRFFDHGDLRFVVLKLIADKPSHGYELIKAIETDESFLEGLRLRLAYHAPADPGAEMEILTKALARADQSARPARPAPAALPLPGVRLPAGLTLEAQEGRLVLKGKGVTEALARDLARWLADRRR